MEPLASRLRPRSLAEVVGQEHLTGPGSPLRRLIEGSTSTSVVLWGPPGVGKTTLARLIATETHRPFKELSAVTAGVKDIRAVMDEAATAPIAPVLFVDEVHRFSKTQQDALLPGVESGRVTLVAATTENPSFSLVGPLLSRSLLLTLRPLTDDDIATVLQRGAEELHAVIEPEALEHLQRLSGGDARSALTALEAASGPDVITLADVERAIDTKAPRYDRDGDQHYDIVSAFIKSVRGSDPDAALHWLARMMSAGEDPRFIARRLMILASEDIGLADPTALPTAVAAAQTVQLIGMPEAQLTLAHATLHLALAPKSNSAYLAINEAMGDVARGVGGPVPPALRDRHYKGAERLHGAETVRPYVYPHDVPGGVVAQQYAPDDVLRRTYYRPTQRGAEKVLAERADKLRRIVREESS